MRSAARPADAGGRDRRDNAKGLGACGRRCLTTGSPLLDGRYRPRERPSAVKAPAANAVEPPIATSPPYPSRPMLPERQEVGKVVVSGWFGGQRWKRSSVRPDNTPHTVGQA